MSITTGLGFESVLFPQDLQVAALSGFFIGAGSRRLEIVVGDRVHHSVYERRHALLCLRDLERQPRLLCRRIGRTEPQLSRNAGWTHLSQVGQESAPQRTVRGEFRDPLRGCSPEQTGQFRDRKANQLSSSSPPMVFTCFFKGSRHLIGKGGGVVSWIETQ